MNLPDFKRLIAPITRKIFLLLGRGILQAIDNSEGTQKIQITALDGETISDMERFQEYGFETYPLSNSEVLSVFFNGNRDHGIAICVHDRRYRPKDLTEGEIVMYTDEDATTPFRIQMKRNRIHYRRSDIEDIDIDSSKTEDIGGNKTETIGGNKTENISGGKSIAIVGAQTKSAASETETITGTKQTNAAAYLVVASSIILNGTTIIGGGAGSGKAVATEDIISVFNNHTHDVIGAVTDPPNTTLSSSCDLLSVNKLIITAVSNPVSFSKS